MTAGNKLPGFPFCSATNGTFYQSRPAGTDSVFPCCSLILSSVELRCILNTKLNCLVSINLVSSLRWGWLLLDSSLS